MPPPLPAASTDGSRLDISQFCLRREGICQNVHALSSSNIGSRSTRMKLLMHGLEPFPIDVSVNLCRANTGMAQQFLHGTQVGASGKEGGGEAMPQGLRADLGFQPRAFGILLHEHPQHFARQRLAAAADKYLRSIRDA